MTARDARRERLTLAAASIALIMVMLNVSIVNTALPAIQAELGGGLLGQQWVVNAYNLVFAALLLLGGFLGDRLGHRRVLLGGLLISIGGTLVAALAPTIGILLAARASQGLGSALVQPATLALITYTFIEPSARAKALGIWGAIAGLGIAIGPVAGGVLVDSIGWRAVFVAIAPVGLAALLVTLNGVSETPPQQRRLDRSGLLLITVALAALSLGLSEGQRLGFATLPALILLATAVVACSLFLYVERRTEAALVDLGAFRQPAFAVANLNGLLAFSGSFPILTYLGIHLQEQAGLSATQAGLLILLFPLAFAGASIGGARLLARVGPRLPVVLGMLIAASGGIALAWRGVDVQPFGVWWQVALLGTGVGLSMSSLTATAVGAVALERSGMAASLLGTLRQVGTALGVAVLGIVVASAPDLERGLRLAALAAGAVLLLAAGTGALWLPGKAVALPHSKPDEVLAVEPVSAE